MFINQSLKSFHTMLNARLQRFRDEELWHHPVQQVLSNNEVGLRALFDMYSQRKEKYLTPDDVIKMVYEDAELDLGIEKIRIAYALSKMTVMVEDDDKDGKRYKKMTFEEFCEFIARCVEMLFKESELEELPLDEKLEYILEDLLPLAG